MHPKQQCWSYSFILSTCTLGLDKEHGGRVRKMTNPFTGVTIEISIENNMTPDERAAVREVFQRFGFAINELCDPHQYALTFPSGDEIGFRCGSFEVPGARVVGFEVILLVRELSDAVLDLVLTVARAGNFALESLSDEAQCLVKESSDPAVHKKWPDARVLGTTADLRDWLEKDLGGRLVNMPDYS